MYTSFKLANPFETNNEKMDNLSSVLELFLDISSSEVIEVHEDESTDSKYE